MSDHGAKILDLTYLAEAANGDLDFVNEILGDYLVEMVKYLSCMEAQLRDSDLQPLLRSAHTIKGASANVGATRVRETAAKLEAQAKKGSIEGGGSLIALLNQEVLRVKELVEREGVPALLKAVS
jgi:HPt (histidine-containing phosphotransfer) domain-containing protein